MAEEAKPRNSVVTTTFSYIEQAMFAKTTRMLRNRDNFEAYHLRDDFQHKIKGQSREFLSKQQRATDQLTSFLTQGLIDVGMWFKVETEPGVSDEDKILSDDHSQKLLKRQLAKNKFPYLIADAVKLGLLASLMIIKVGSKKTTKTKFRASQTEDGPKLERIEKEVSEIDLQLVRQEDYLPDPTGDGLYELQRIEMDRHKLLQIARDNPDVYNIEAVKNLPGDTEEDQDAKKSTETNQNHHTIRQTRRRVIIWEGWGTILEPGGMGEVLHKNVVWAISDSGVLIRPPKPNPFWHGKSPFMTAPIIRVPHSVWHRAVMDAATMHNHTLNEQFNYNVDAALMSTFGIRQIHTDWLEDANQVSEGIAPGTTLQVNALAPPGAKVLETVSTSTPDRQGIEMFNIIDREFQQSSMVNDVSLGNLPERTVKATEIVASNQALSGVFQGIVKGIEEQFLSPLLEKCFAVMMQNVDDFDQAAVKALIGDEAGVRLQAMSKEERFAKTVEGKKFKVFGLSTTINKINDFRKLTTLLQTIAGSEPLMIEFQKGNSMQKFLKEIFTSLDIDPEKFQADPEDKELAERKQELTLAGQEVDIMSQVTQASGLKGEDQIQPPSAELSGGGITRPNG